MHDPIQKSLAIFGIPVAKQEKNLCTVEICLINLQSLWFVNVQHYWGNGFARDGSKRDSNWWMVILYNLWSLLSVGSTNVYQLISTSVVSNRLCSDFCCLSRKRHLIVPTAKQQYQNFRILQLNEYHCATYYLCSCTTFSVPSLAFYQNIMARNDVPFCCLIATMLSLITGPREALWFWLAFCC